MGATGETQGKIAHDPARIPPLEVLEHDLGYQEREWRVQYFAWFVISLILAAALIGLFGGSPFMRKREAASNAAIEYDRFSRKSADSELIVTAIGPNGTELRVQLSSELMRDFDIDHTSPPPESVEITEEGVIYIYPTSPAAKRAEISFHLRPQAVGTVRGTVVVSHGGLNPGPGPEKPSEPMEVRQFVYP